MALRVSNQRPTRNVVLIDMVASVVPLDGLGQRDDRHVVAAAEHVGRQAVVRQAEQRLQQIRHRSRDRISARQPHQGRNTGCKARANTSRIESHHISWRHRDIEARSSTSTQRNVPLTSCDSCAGGTRLAGPFSPPPPATCTCGSMMPGSTMLPFMCKASSDVSPESEAAASIWRSIDGAAVGQVREPPPTHLAAATAAGACCMARILVPPIRMSIMPSGCGAQTLQSSSSVMGACFGGGAGVPSREADDEPTRCW